MEYEPDRLTSKKIVAAAGVILVIAFILLVSTSAGNSSGSAQSKAPGLAAGASSAGPAAPTGTVTAVYKDGSYSAGGTYSSPGGAEEITVDATIQNNTVTSISIEQVANNPNSAEFQRRFKQNYSSLVVGRKLSDIHLSRVSGSSLTSIGFNQALESIKTQASQSS